MDASIYLEVTVVLRTVVISDSNLRQKITQPNHPSFLASFACKTMDVGSAGGLFGGGFRLLGHLQED